MNTIGLIGTGGIGMKADNDASSFIAILLGITDGFFLPWEAVEDNMRSGYAEWRERYES